MAIGNRQARSAGIVQGPQRAANTNNDILALDLSGYAEGYGFVTSGFAADATGGWKGQYYLDGNTHVEFVSIERFNITGTNYADTIQTGDGNDVINAGGGNDLVYSGLGKDNLDGGAGIDGISRNLVNSTAAININLATNTVTAAYGQIRNFEYFAGFTGGSGNDVFVSSAARGNDTVNGGDGNDRVEFVRGYDTFAGGGDNDTLKADYSWSDVGAGIVMSFSAESSGEGFQGYIFLDGPNRVNFGTTENFEIIGTRYNDAMITGSGNDILSGLAGDDDLRSGSGIDVLDGGDGVDGVGRDFSALTGDVAIDLAAGTLTGVGGQITNFEYFSQIIGGAGNDTFTSTHVVRNDNVTGGGGNDTASFFGGYDAFAGGLNTDRAIVDFSDSITGEAIITSLNVDTNGGYNGYFFVNNSVRLDFSSVEAFTVTGTMFGDTIITGDGADVIAAGDGYDVVRSGGGDDVLDGGAGLDGVGRTFTNAANNIGINLLLGTVTGIGGSITNFEYFTQLTTGSGNDRLVSTRFFLNDTLTTGGGNDIFTSYAGADTYNAGIGADRLIIDWSQLALGVGINAISQSVDTDGGYRGYFFIGGNARVDYTSVEAFDITGTAYNDQIQSREGNDNLNGLAGNDQINAGAGNDALDGGDGIDGFAKDFTAATADITVDLTRSRITGAATTIAGMEYLLDVRTGGGADKFITLAGKYNDVAWGGGGNDTAYFYSGADRFEAGSGKDTLIVDYSALDTDSGISTSMAADTSNGGFRGYYYVEGDNRIDFTGIETAWVTGTKNNDTITGASGNDRFVGGDGRDTLAGSDGNDVLDGGAASDTLDGGAGNDQLTGGRGSDTLTGGAGADTFFFDDGDSGVGTIYVDRIADFNRSVDKDKIDVSGIDANSAVADDQAFTFIGTAAFTAAGQLHLVTIDGNQYLQGNTDADLDPEFAIRITGEVPIATDFVL